MMRFLNRLRLQWRQQAEERGTAFITTLFIVTLMAVLSVELVESSRFAIHRSINSDQRDQAYWYAMGAREYALSSLQRSGAPARPAMSPQEVWVQGERTFSLDNGELIGRVRDQNNCINLNAFVQNRRVEDDAIAVSLDAEATRTMFTHVAEHLGLSPNTVEPLKAQIIDWIDADTRPEPGGAEDVTYRQMVPAYRAANQPFVEKAELLALPSMTPDIYRLIADWVCVFPIDRQPPININTLQPEQAILLSAMTDLTLRRIDAEDILIDRPIQGFETLDVFYDRALARNGELGDRLIGTTTLRSQWFEIDVRVDLGNMPFTYNELITMAPNGRLTRVTHRFGAIQ